MNGEFFPVVVDQDACRANARAVLKQIVARLGGKVASAATGLHDSHVSKALGDSPGDRYLCDEHVDALLALATNPERVAYWTARMAPYGYVPGVVSPRTAAERLAELELRVVMACGAAGAAVVEAERSKP